MATLGVVNPTINLATPTVGSTVNNSLGSTVNVTGQNTPITTPVSTPNGLTISSVSNPYGVTNNTTTTANGNSLNVADVSNADTTDNATENTGTGTSLNSDKETSLNPTSANSMANGQSSSSLLNPSNIEGTAQKLYGLLGNGTTSSSGTSGIVDTGLSSGVDGTGEGLVASVGDDGSASFGGDVVASIGDDGVTSLSSGVAPEAIGSTVGEASTGVSSGLGSGLASGLETGGVGLAGGLVGSEVGSLAGTPVGGGLSGAASGAATGALIGSVVPGVGTAIGAVVGGLAGLFSGVMSGQKPTVGPDGNTSIQGWNAQTNQPNFVNGQDNGGSSAQANTVATQGWDAVTSILKNLGGAPTGASGVNVGTFKGQYTVGNPGTGYIDKNNNTVNVGNNQTANSFQTGTNAEAEFITQQLNYIGQNGKATGLSQDQLNQLGQISYQDVLAGKIPGMSTSAASSTTPTTNTDWGAIGAQKNSAGVAGYDKGGFVEGEGGPRDDKVDAKLSNEEFVWPADVVDRLGGGDGSNSDPEASKRGARTLVALIDHIRGPDASKYGRPKNVEGVETPHFGLGGGMFMNTEFSQGGSVGQIDRPTNISSPTGFDSSDMGYGTGGLIPRPGNNSNNFNRGGVILKGTMAYADGGMTPYPNNNFHDGGLVRDNNENDTQQPRSAFHKHTKFQQRKSSGYDAHGIAQDLGMEGNYGHNYASGGFVIDKDNRPTRRGTFAKDNYKKGGLVKRPAPLTPPNATFYN